MKISGSYLGRLNCEANLATQFSKLSGNSQCCSFEGKWTKILAIFKAQILFKGFTNYPYLVCQQNPNPTLTAYIQQLLMSLSAREWTKK